jgi:hypothetical protein
MLTSRGRDATVTLPSLALDLSMQGSGLATHTSQSRDCLFVALLGTRTPVHTRCGQAALWGSGVLAGKE